MLRGPALPVEVFHALAQWTVDGHWRSGAARHGLARNGDPVAGLLDHPYVALALTIASPSLAAALGLGPIAPFEGPGPAIAPAVNPPVG